MPSVRLLLEDVEDRALAHPRRRGREKRPHGAGGAAFFADDLAQIVGSHRQLQHDGAVLLDDVHLDGVGIVHQRARDVRDQVL